MRRLILGTDWWSDCDDAVAVRLLTRFVKDKKIELAGIVINACMEDSVASLCGFLRADGVEAIPVGIDRSATDFGGRLSYQRRLAETYAPDLTNGDAVDGVRLYRQILAESEEQVEIMEIGFLQVIAALLKSGADDISPKNGVDLVREKVKKIWVMAGKWDGEGEKEHNFCLNDRSRRAGKEFCELCPVPVTFLGWEIGHNVITGDRLPHDDHLYAVLRDHGSQKGRHSWDPMLVLLALIGDEKEAGYEKVTGKAFVDPESGANYFSKEPCGLHAYVIKERSDDFYAEAINRLL